MKCVAASGVSLDVVHICQTFCRGTRLLEAHRASVRLMWIVRMEGTPREYINLRDMARVAIEPVGCRSDHDCASACRRTQCTKRSPPMVRERSTRLTYCQLMQVSCELVKEKQQAVYFLELQRKRWVEDTRANLVLKGLWETGRSRHFAITRPTHGL